MLIHYSSGTVQYGTRNCDSINMQYCYASDPAFARMYPNDPDSHSTLQAQQRAYLQFQRDRIEKLKANPGDST